MRCIGRTKYLSRCKKNTPFLYCKDHNRQWILLLFISIPTVLGIYIGLYKDLFASSGNSTNNQISQFENKQINETLRMLSTLNSFFCANKVIMNDSYLDSCTNKQFIRKCGDYYSVIWEGRLQVFLDKFEASYVDWEPECKIGIVEDLDTVMHDKKIKNLIIKLKQTDKLFCAFPKNGKLIFENDTSFNFFKALNRNIYLPTKIKEKTTFFDSIYFNPTTLKKCFENNFCYLMNIFSEYPNKNYTYTPKANQKSANSTSSHDKVYVLYCNGNELTHDLFIRKILDIYLEANAYLALHNIPI